MSPAPFFRPGLGIVDFDVRSEAMRIAKATGFSPILTARDLVEARIAARIDMTWDDTIVFGRGQCPPMTTPVVV
jgi:hypothetical protein